MTIATSGKRAVVLVDELYEELEAWCPIIRLQEAGVDVTVAATEAGKTYEGLHGYTIQADAATADLGVDDFDLIVIPGGYAPDLLRTDVHVLRLVREADREGKVIASLCHGPWVLASAAIVHGRTLTSLSRIRHDMENAGANWIDQDVVIDNNLITSRTPADLPVFCKAMMAILGGENVEVAHAQAAVL